MVQILVLLSIIGCLLTSPLTVRAQSDFSLSFNVEYRFDEQGNATVTNRIELTNLNTDTYPSVYLVDVPDDASNVAAVDEKGKLTTDIVEEGGRRMVRISLSSQNIGQSRKTNMTLSFDTRALSRREGEVWQIGIPPFSTDEHIVTYDTTIIPPESWGIASYVSPSSETPGLWTIDERGEDAIIMMFGELAPSVTPATTNTSPQRLIIVIGVLAGIVITAILFFVLNKKRSAS